MSYVEAVIIPKREYEASREDRILEGDLEVDELYTAMLSLTANTMKQEAAKIPTRVSKITKTESGIYLANLIVMDKNLREKAKIESKIADGFSLDVADRLTINTIPVAECYFKDYGDTVDTELQKILEGVLIPA